MTIRTWARALATGLTSTAVAVLLTAAPAGATTAGAAVASPPAHLTECSAESYQGDKRLGPATLPKLGLVGLELIGYRRTGGMTPAAFLAKYWDATLYGGTGGWIYPPQNGYLLRSDGTPIQWVQELRPGQAIDRYGSEYGAFLSPTGLPYLTRAIPPTNLNSTPPGPCNYHNYRVLKAFSVDAGPIAPWFAQPGRGLQYQLDAGLVPGSPATVNVVWLVDNGYLQRLN